jgi:hypothetical protein
LALCGMLLPDELGKREIWAPPMGTVAVNEDLLRVRIDAIGRTHDSCPCFDDSGRKDDAA